MSNVQFDMKNKVALVTSGGEGIGRETATAFARAGAAVMVADRKLASAKTTAGVIHVAGGTATAIQVDVTSDDEVAQMIARTVSLYGALDYAFNNAAFEGVGAVIEAQTEADWDRVIAVNLKGAWLCMKHEIPRMIETGGVIVNCASIAGLVGFRAAAPYVASKHGLVGLSRTAALELAKSPVRVNVVCPGPIHDPMIDRALHDDRARVGALASADPMGRLGRPEEVAAAVLWLCSDASSFVTGAVLPIDGGWTAQ